MDRRALARSRSGHRRGRRLRHRRFPAAAAASSRPSSAEPLRQVRGPRRRPCRVLRRTGRAAERHHVHRVRRRRAQHRLVTDRLRRRGLRRVEPHRGADGPRRPRDAGLARTRTHGPVPRLVRPAWSRVDRVRCRDHRSCRVASHVDTGRRPSRSPSRSASSLTASAPPPWPVAMRPGTRRPLSPMESAPAHRTTLAPQLPPPPSLTGAPRAVSRACSVVGLPGFEPGTFGPPDRRANQAAPQPVHGLSRGRQCRRRPSRTSGRRAAQSPACQLKRIATSGGRWTTRRRPEEPLDALHGAVAEVDREGAGEEPEVPRDRREVLVVVGVAAARWPRSAAWAWPGSTDPPTRRAGAVDLHRRG